MPHPTFAATTFATDDAAGLAIPNFNSQNRVDLGIHFHADAAENERYRMRSAANGSNVPHDSTISYEVSGDMIKLLAEEHYPIQEADGLKWETLNLEFKTIRDGVSHLHRLLAVSIHKMGELEPLFQQIEEICGRETRTVTIVVKGANREVHNLFDKKHIYPQHAVNADELMVCTKGFKKDATLEKRKSMEELVASDFQKSKAYIIHKTQTLDPQGSRSMFWDYVTETKENWASMTGYLHVNCQRCN